ncbi:MAG: PUR family DNA/RNA-binding protein [Bacteroidales bacterium]|nr:PUR family DNA/RNA-binding protein [Bacteroidales bacterium]
MTEDGIEKTEGTEKNQRQEIFSRAVRAGKRTYFFDVKSTRRDDYYLTITESKKRFNRDGRYYFEKHKIFLYKEDFEKFLEGLTESVEFIKRERPEIIRNDEEFEDDQNVSQELEGATADEYSANVDFEDLEDKAE